jgi:ribose-phosphate pyrophosphokinase
MITLNLLYPGQSDIGFTTMLFPDGQPHIKLDMATIKKYAPAAPVRILCRITSSDELMLVLLAMHTLQYLEFEKVELHVAYLMAARMDRVMQSGEPFSLKVVAGMLNAAGFSKVLVFDPHSEMATALIDRSYPVTNHAYVKDALAHYLEGHQPEHYCLVAPDGGALKKIYQLAAWLQVDHIVACSKERDPKTGALSNFSTSATDLAGATCVIVDDLCDGGGTFAGTAALLKSRGAGKVVLVVSHGIFSRGIAIHSVDAIYSTDSYRHTSGINCLPVSRYL